jgi:hypothetical protein
MRCLALPLALAAISTGTVLAEPAPTAEPPPGLPIAVAVNLPLSWLWSSFGHHAIRASYARYRGPIWRLLPAALASDGDLEEGAIPPDFGHTTDLSVGWTYHPRRVLDGASVEVGAQCRLNRLRDRIDAQNVASEEDHTNVCGAHALAGWTWRLSDWWFVATSLGASAGYARGREKKFAGYATIDNTFMEIITDERVSRLDLSIEAYLRVGLAFGP